MGKLKRVVLLACLLTIVSCCTAKKADKTLIKGAGTVTYIKLEGGFYGIVADDGNQYDPINLTDEFKKEGLRVKFNARPRNDLASFHMWGTLVELTDIEEIK